MKKRFLLACVACAFSATLLLTGCGEGKGAEDTGEDGKVGFATDEFYYKDTGEMEMLFSRYPGAIENTVRIAERCNLEFDFTKTYLPKFPCPDGLTAGEYLARLTEEGLSRRVRDGQIVFDDGKHSEQAYRDRIAYELGVIGSMGYDD